ncbi:hypothetical protein N0V88_002843 [Collariella sp. IMI 366227]|nr:hypothetical protein N0V88_002843 [Collariella sp. IMI 366227]
MEGAAQTETKEQTALMTAAAAALSAAQQQTVSSDTEQQQEQQQQSAIWQTPTTTTTPPGPSPAVDDTTALATKSPPPQPQTQAVLLPQAAPPPPPPSHHRASLIKPVIMDPPAARKAASQQAQRNVSGFPSPTMDHASINPKFVDDCTRMNFAVQQSLPEAVRRIVRDHWEKCLLGSEFHQAFTLNAAIHHAPPSITQRAVRDFGHKMVTESKHELAAHFTTELLDEVADVLIAKASDSFLDKCLEKRLLTIEAKPLINALAKAERLGYEPGDIVQDDQNERVIPQEAYPGANGHPLQAAAPAVAPTATPVHPPPATHTLQCLKCFRTFEHTSAYDYHRHPQICRRHLQHPGLHRLPASNPYAHLTPSN